MNQMTHVTFLYATVYMIFNCAVKTVIPVYTAPTATAARNICHTLPLTAHGHCPAKKEPVTQTGSL